jgi:N6-L-threonylcarbamoyladenine synthase
VPEIVLGIESSCDEMAAAIVRRGTEVLASVVRDQREVHRPYGGVVPELASRDHVRSVSQVVASALREGGVSDRDLRGVAVTVGPGLLGSLLVGLSFGKALAYRLGIPVVGVHHLAGHLAAAELCAEELRPPYIGLVVSGGHTALYRIEEGAAPALLGETRDDAVGEAFDKVAKLLGLPYPGGAALSRAAERGNPRAVDFPRPMQEEPGLDFSYSGLKTAVALEVARRGPIGETAVADIAASFEVAATDVLISRARRALRQEGIGRLAVVGGVAANRVLRLNAAAAARRDGFRAFFPPPELCTDNAVMIASAGASLLGQGFRDGPELTCFSRVPLSRSPWVGGGED